MLALNLNHYLRFLKKVFTANNHELVGLDINSDYIKLLKINSKVTPHQIENMVILPMPSGAIVKDQMKNLSLVAGQLKKAFRKSHLKNKNIAISIPRSWTITKNITVNAHLTMDEIESRVWIEADRHFSSLVGGIYLDFVVLGPSQKVPEQLDLMLVASRKDQIDPYLSALRLADLDVKVVDVNNYALERALMLTNPQLVQAKTIALLNLDYSLMSLLVINDGELIYSNDQAYEGHQLLHSNQLATSDSAKDDIPEVKFISYIRHIMQFFYSSRPNVKLDLMLLAGDCATKLNVVDLIQKEIGIEINILNPFQNMNISPKVNVEQLQQEAAALTLCCGLALSEIK